MNHATPCRRMQTPGVYRSTTFGAGNDFESGIIPVIGVEGHGEEQFWKIIRKIILKSPHFLFESYISG